MESRKRVVKKLFDTFLKIVGKKYDSIVVRRKACHISCKRENRNVLSLWNIQKERCGEVFIWANSFKTPSLFSGGDCQYYWAYQSRNQTTAKTCRVPIIIILPCLFLHNLWCIQCTRSCKDLLLSCILNRAPLHRCLQPYSHIF